MVVHNLLQEKDIQAIANAYGLTTVSFEPVEGGGSGNSNYLLNTEQGQFILTMFNDQNIEFADVLGRLLLILAENDFPTNRLLSPLKGGTTMTYNGKPVMIKLYISGQVHRNPDKIMLRQVGEAMAKLHQIPVPDFLPERIPYGVASFLTVMGQNIDRSFESWIGRRLPELEREIKIDLPQGLIHSDLFYDNVLFEGQQMQAVIDFEDAMQHVFVFDLAMGIVGFCGEWRGSFDHVRGLVEGYQQIRELQEREKESLQLFVEYAAATVSCWRFWRYHIHTTSTSTADKHWHMATIAQETRGMTQAQFLDSLFE
jgi:homoserine kinase type II